MAATATLLPKVHDLNCNSNSRRNLYSHRYLNSRRSFLLAAAALPFMGNKVFASNKIGWNEFRNNMARLATASNQIKNETITIRGMQYLKQLDILSTEYKSAVKASYETGNRYWLWQRMIKEKNINGGILNIDSEQLVQLHDHPGATGLLRVLRGEVEVWQFDKIEEKQIPKGDNIAKLARVSHKVLRAGDTAVLTPTKGNIHALRAISKQCSMLDFFIPPYKRSERSWYEPLTNNWFNNENISCRKISQHAYTKA